MTLELMAGAAGMAAAALGVSLWGLWRASVAQGAVEAALKQGLGAIEARIEATQAPPAPPPGLDALPGMREDVSVLFNHIAALTAGQIELQKTVETSLSEAAERIVAQMTDHDRRAIARTEVLRDDQQKVSEQIETVVERLAELRVAVHDEVAPVLDCAVALSGQIGDVAGAVGAPTAAGADPAALRATFAEALESLAASLRGEVETAAAALRADAGTAAASAADLQRRIEAAAEASAAATADLRRQIETVAGSSTAAAADLRREVEAAAAASGAAAAELRADMKAAAEALRAEVGAAAAASSGLAAALRADLRQDVEAAVAASSRAAAAPRVFNTGRVVSLFQSAAVPAPEVAP